MRGQRAKLFLPPSPFSRFSFFENILERCFHCEIPPNSYYVFFFYTFSFVFCLLPDERQADEELQMRGPPSGPRGVLRERLSSARPRAAVVSQVTSDP